MKYLISIVSVIAIIATLGFFSLCQKDVEPEYLRIHIRANSNSTIDQNVKYKVKDEIVNALIPLLSEATSKEKADEIINANLDLIESVADKVLKENGFNYYSKARLAIEEFPTRTYEGLTLESGFYDALILELGSGSGDNWWCVVYPPLCFLNGNSSNVVYKSRILEIIKQAFN